MLTKSKIQNFGSFLSSMIIPNISIFITWGIMTSLFIPLGWQPNKMLAQLIPPIIFYLLPILIGYTGGRLIAGERGGVIGSITTIGMIVSTHTPMLLGAMVAGPFGAWVIKKFDEIVKNKIKNGFEMLVNNFSIAIIGIFLIIISFFLIGPSIEWSSNVLKSLVKIIIEHNLLPLIAIIVEPAKVFFLNNVINHGIFSPLGIQEISENKSSLFFLIESNPGPGLGILMACFYFGKGKLYQSSGAAAIIQFLGGVHEIYFPYVLIKPELMISLILGSMTNIFMLVFFKGGLISAISPGSILSILAMTQKNLYFANIFSILSSFIVSFISAFLFFRFPLNKIQETNGLVNKLSKDIFNELDKNQKNKIDNQEKHIFLKNVKKIIVACDAGMGSSAIGASILQKKIKDANLENICVSNCSIHSLPKDADLIITHQKLTYRAKKYAPNICHISLNNFIDNDFYDSLIKKLIKDISCKNDINYKNSKIINNVDSSQELNNLFQLTEKNIFLNQNAKNKEEAISIVGQHLVNQGYVKNNYVEAMLEREKISSTWIGESIALPHGTIQAKDNILKTGIIFCQFPKGVRFGENVDDIAHLVIGIAAKNNEHIMVVSSITNALDNKDVILKLSNTKNVQEVLFYLNEKK